ncbi:MAG: TatD family deoxyribonuclease [Promethearchaeota archaeon]|nr:MAG: TatD family deoxyribonuclease [Candidatus Lokiarchaeota archaeon]
MLIDVHCHANLYMIVDPILKEAKNAGVEKILCVAMSAISQNRVLELCNSHEMLYPALGIHPEEVEENENIEAQLEGILHKIHDNRDQLCAIGEIGLDHHFQKNKELYPLQRKIFESMLQIAQDLNLPVNLHTKGAEKEVFDILPSYKLPHINIHWYSGPEPQLKTGIERGYYFSITPALKYSPPMQRVVSLVEVDHLLLESDGPVKYAGQTGVPAMVREVLTRIAHLKNLEVHQLEKQIQENTQNVFPKLFES